MEKLTNEQVMEVKAKGFLRNRGTNNFSGRLLPVGGVFSAQELKAIAEIAENFGNGKVAFTSRLTAEIVGIPYDKINEAIEYAAKYNMEFGGTGAKVRPITSCKGTTCIFGNYDTQELASELHERYYIGWGDVKLPHKFKIGVGGCPNSCMKPSLNDFGVEGRKVAVYDDNGKHCGTKVQYQIYVGGTWGKETRMGTPLSKLVDYEDIFPLVEKTMLWFKENAYQKERLGKAVDRVGASKLEEALFGDDILNRKDDILAREILTK